MSSLDSSESECKDTMHYGYVEIKCPYTSRDVNIREACRDPLFFCRFDETTNKITLRQEHKYYCQIQGQMAIGKRPWCDFIVWTKLSLTMIFGHNNCYQSCLLFMIFVMPLKLFHRFMC